MTDPDTLRALAKELCEAKEGSRELDARIVTTICPDATVGEYIEGWGDDIVFHARDLGIPDKSECPHYTTSLDAKLPGEDIVVVSAPGYFSSGHTGSNYKWGAKQKYEKPVFAHTEPLARRAAALLAMAEQKEREG